MRALSMGPRRVLAWLASCTATADAAASAATACGAGRGARVGEGCE